jgi:hypothetical protein
MAYVDLTTGEIATGEPVSTNMLNKIKDNFADHEARLLSAEAGTSVDYPSIMFRVGGMLGTGTTLPYTALATIVRPFGITVTGVRLYIGTAGTSGTTEIDLKYKRGVGALTSIFTTKPSVVFSAGSGAQSSNAVLNASEVDLQVGDILQLSFTSEQIGAADFIIAVDFTKT